MTVGASADLAHFVLDGRVLAFTAGLMIATTLGFGLLPALRLTCGVISQCDNTAGSYTFPDYARSSGERIVIRENRIGVDYFRVIGMPVVEGRGFTTDDAGGSPKVAVVNQALARTYFGTLHAVGRHFRHDLGRGDDEYEVIGVVRDALCSTSMTHRGR
jgi:hypothetical protein